MATSSRIAERYPSARIRGQRTTRLPETPLDWVNLDAALADELGREQLGWYVGDYPVGEAVLNDLTRLNGNPEGGVWVVVPHSRDLARTLFDRWPHEKVPTDNKDRSVWMSNKIWVAIPEDLRDVLPQARRVEPGIAGIIVVDPFCTVYKTRGGMNDWGHRHTNDRPQHVVNFRAALEVEGWQPPLILLTSVPARAVSTQNVARAFCLHGFQFIAGASFTCWDRPIQME